MKDDIELIRAIADGNKEAFSILYERYSSIIYNTALSYSKNVKDAEEITQSVFIQIHKNAAKFKRLSSLNTWIYRITVNLSINLLKKKNRFLTFKSNYKEEHVEFEHPGVILEQKENAKFLFKAMHNLPEKQKTAFILFYIENLAQQEVADIMDTTLKAVESLLQRAKKNLRIKLKALNPNRRN